MRGAFGIEASHDVSVKEMQMASAFPSVRWAWADSRLSVRSLPSLTSVILEGQFTSEVNRSPI